jgi:hypothetical protein
MKFEDIRAQALADIRGDRRFWRWTMVPLIVTLGVLAVVLGAIAAFGIYVSVEQIRTGVMTAELKDFGKLIVGSGSGLLGVVVVRLFTQVATTSKVFHSGEARFTAYATKVRLAVSKDTLTSIMHDYHRDA